MKQVSKEVVVVPPGSYYLGDPAYSLSRKDYDHYVLDRLGMSEDEALAANAEVDIVVFSTHHGDGTFEDQDGNTYGVDSGHIALVPAVAGRPRPERQKYVTKVTFAQPAECFNDNGVLHFGDSVIDTTF